MGDKKGSTDGFKDRLVSPSSEFGLNTAGCMAPNRRGFGAFLVAYTGCPYLFFRSLPFFEYDFVFSFVFVSVFVFAFVFVWRL